MSLVDTSGNRPVHFPADPAAFKFDAEVSKIFPDMAARSIPNFYAAHQAHARMLAPFVRDRDHTDVLDIGASRGAFFEAMLNEYGDAGASERMDFTAIDNSPEMCAYLRSDFPGASTLEWDVMGPEFMNHVHLYDVVCVHYVLQFVPKEHQDRVLKKIFSLVKPGGVLIYGHKSAHYGTLGDAAHAEYIEFRVSNGYTREEIAAKSKALKGSMFCTDHEVLMGSVRNYFTEVQETFRFMMFSAFMAVK